ncbi:MAG: hypothetical protein ABFS56_02345 [Pseudomonadota bacterium]
MSKHIFIVILMLGTLTACAEKRLYMETDRSQPMESGSRVLSGGSGPFYKIGRNAAESNARSAWDNLGRDCQKVPSFVQIMEDGMDDVVADMGTIYQGQSANSFGSGYLAGLSSVLDDVRAQCQDPSVIAQLDQLEQFCRGKF